jgi:two-component system, NtrC family, response regulator HydG
MILQHTGYILVIDDDSMIGEVIFEVLTDVGYIVLSVSSGADALPALTAHPPTLCLVDMRLHRMSAMDAIEHLHAQGFAQSPIVVMTTSTQDAELICAAGFACLDKPFDIDDLLACVARYVSPHQGSIAICA